MFSLLLTHLLACAPDAPATSDSEPFVPTDSESDVEYDVDLTEVETLFQEHALDQLMWMRPSQAEQAILTAAHAAQRVCGYEEGDDLEGQSYSCGDDSTGQASLHSEVDGYEHQDDYIIVLTVVEDGERWYSSGRTETTRQIDDEGTVLALYSRVNLELEHPESAGHPWGGGRTDANLVVNYSTRYAVDRVEIEGNAGFPASTGIAGVNATALYLLENPACPEPHGTLGVRSLDGFWYYAEFDGPWWDESIGPETGIVGEGDTGLDSESCDGCGTLSVLTSEVGEICLDFSPLYGVAW